MKVIALIPARYHATRLPAKLVQKIGSLPVIAHTYQNAKNSGLFDEAYVVANDARIIQIIKAIEGKTILSQKTHPSGTDRIAEALALADLPEETLILNIQGDEPFIDTDSLRQLINVFKEDTAKKIAVASLMTPIKDTESITAHSCVKVVTDKCGYALYFSRLPIPFVREPEKHRPLYYKHIGVYGFRTPALRAFPKLAPCPLESSEQIECLRFLSHQIPIKMVCVSSYTGVSIDTEADLQKARLYYQQL